MTCYVPALRVIAVSGVAAWLLWHKTITHILDLAGLVLGITAAAAAASAAAGLVIWLTRRIQRRRAQAGGCTGCRFRCQRDLTLPVPRPAAVAARPRPAAVTPPRVRDPALDRVG
jgi:hypothetical protein